MATYYPLHHQALVWPLSALFLLNSIPNSIFTHANAVALFATIAREAKSIKLHYKALKHLPCKPISMRGAGHVLFNLNTHKTAANDNFYKRSA